MRSKRRFQSTIAAMAIASAVAGCAATAPTDEGAMMALRAAGYTQIELGDWGTCHPGGGREFTARAQSGQFVYGWVCNQHGGFARDRSLRISIHTASQ